MKKEEVPQNISAFPLGKENTGFKQYFTGESWLAPLTGNKDLNVPMSNVTFEPGCRNNWHSHTGGQILIAVGGVGYYQERGKQHLISDADKVHHFSHACIGYCLVKDFLYFYRSDTCIESAFKHHPVFGLCL